MMLTKPRGIIFDWDGTIVDSMPLINEAMNYARSRYDIPPATLAETIKDSIHSGEAIFRRDWGDDRWEEARGLFLEHFLARHLDRFGAEAERGRKSFMPGAYELLSWLQTHPEIPCGVLTNRTRISAGPEIEFLGYDHFFKAVVCYGESPKGKPSPDAAYHILEMMHLPPEPNIWLVGDTCGDVTCGINAGLTCILVSPDEYTENPLPTIHLPSCNALLEQLKALY